MSGDPDVKSEGRVEEERVGLMAELSPAAPNFNLSRGSTYLKSGPFGQNYNPQLPRYLQHEV